MSSSSPNPSPAQSRLTQVKDFLTFNKTATTPPFDPDSTIFPLRKDLPAIPGAPVGAAWVWGENDYVCNFFYTLFFSLLFWLFVLFGFWSWYWSRLVLMGRVEGSGGSGVWRGRTMGNAEARLWEKAQTMVNECMVGT